MGQPVPLHSVELVNRYPWDTIMATSECLMLIQVMSKPFLYTYYNIWQDEENLKYYLKFSNMTLVLSACLNIIGILEFEAKPHAARITSVVYDDSGMFILTGSADASIKVKFIQLFPKPNDLLQKTRFRILHHLPVVDYLK